MSCKNKQIISQTLNSPYVIETVCEGVTLTHSYEVMLSIYYSTVRVAISLLKLFSAPTRFFNKAEWLYGLFLWRKQNAKGLVFLEILLGWAGLMLLASIFIVTKLSLKRFLTLISRLNFGNLSPILFFWQPWGSLLCSESLFRWGFHICQAH